MSSHGTNLDNHPVATSTQFSEHVPIIDVADLILDPANPDARQKVDEIAQACMDWGFFQIINHGISTQLVNNLWKQTRDFFSLPVEQKLLEERSRDNPWGYYNNELTKNQRDKKEVFDFTREGVDPIYESTNRWPVNESQFKHTMLSYFDACTHLSMILLEAFCVGMNLPGKFMHAEFESNHTGFIRLNYYPVKDPLLDSNLASQSVADLGVHHHTDAGAFTLLVQDDVGGLQVYRDGYWHDIPPEPGAIVINTGDMMQVWSNDTYQAAVHRVLAMDSVDRYSIPFFFNPPANSIVRPLPSVVTEERPDYYNPIEWAEYRGKRTDGDYADYGTEVQISQYRK